MNIAVIPARAGSKRIPNKNIRAFNGRPLITYSIATAIDSRCFDRVIVSTEDDTIAAIAREAGAEVPFVRPTELTGDFVTTGPIIRHAVQWLCDNGPAPERICCVYATAPLLSPTDLRYGLEQLLAHPEKKFAFSITSFPFPIQRAIRLTPDGGVEPFQPECMPMRSQDLEEAFHDAGQFYWGHTRAWLDRLSVFRPHSIPVILPRHRVQDIDTEEDWTRAEYLYRTLQMEKGS